MHFSHIFVYFGVIFQIQLSDSRQVCSSSNASGTCVSIRLCPKILSTITGKSFNTENIRRLQKLTCGFEADDPKVCCPPDEILKPGTIEDSLTFHAESNLFPELEECGKTSVMTSDYIIGGRVPPVGAFPWLARIGFKGRYDPEIIYYCGGAIISKRYILTAAHCVTGVDYDPATDDPFEVRLGEHNTRVDPEYSIELGKQSSFKNYIVEKLIQHPDYSPNSKHNDIALLRLRKNIEFNEFIKPVCLPLLRKYNLTSFPNIGPDDGPSSKLTNAEVAGWGKISNQRREGSTILQSVQVPIVSNSECQRIYTGKTLITSNQLCAGGKFGDSCDGDSGGPLVIYDENSARHFLVALVSFGPTICGTPGYPGIYTRVSSESYLPWIQRNME